MYRTIGFVLIIYFRFSYLFYRPRKERNQILTSLGRDGHNNVGVILLVLEKYELVLLYAPNDRLYPNYLFPIYLPVLSSEKRKKPDFDVRW
jgi:hypothetical protein